MKALSIHITDQCNNSCLFCVVNSHKEKKEGVRRNLLYTFLEEHRNEGYESVNIHGGEASILEDFFSVLDKIRSLNYPEISLQTNGRKLADLNFAKEVCNRGVNLFVISLHGKNAQKHDAATQISGSFDETLEGIRNVKSLGAKVRTNSRTGKLFAIENFEVDSDIITLSKGLTSGYAPLGAVATNKRLSSEIPINAFLPQGFTYSGHPVVVLLS